MERDCSIAIKSPLTMLKWMNSCGIIDHHRHQNFSVSKKEGYQMLRLILSLALCSFTVAQYISNETYAITVFENHSNQTEDQWLSEALPDMLTTDLASSKKVRVVSRQDLKEIIEEQKLSLSGFIQESQQIELGQLLGATRLIIGSYSVMGSQIRIDTKVVNIRSGEVLSSVESTGLKQNVFTLEKLLALKILRSLGAFVSDEDKVALFQLESSNFEAVKSNYLGVIALDDKDPNNAKQFFESAVGADPYYRSAVDNMASIKVSGESLFASITNEIEDKNTQLSKFKKIANEFSNNFWKASINGKPLTETNRSNPNKVDLVVNIDIAVDHTAIKKFIENCKTISGGDIEMIYRAKDIYYNDPSFFLFQDNFKWFEDAHSKQWHNGKSQYWFNHDIYVKLYDNYNSIAEEKFNLALQKEPDLNSIIRAGLAGIKVQPNAFDLLESQFTSDTRNIKNKNLSIRFEGLPMAQIRRITRIDIE